jgi:hypothetical protein
MHLLINYDNDKKTKEKVKKQPTVQDINKKEAKEINQHKSVYSLKL